MSVKRFVEYALGPDCPETFYWAPQVLRGTAFERLRDEYLGLEGFSPSQCVLTRARSVLFGELAFAGKFQWLFVGPAGSGTRMHVDPVGSLAWNAVLHGEKLFRILPPAAAPLLRDASTDAARRSGFYPEFHEPPLELDELPGARRISVRAGDVVFVPAGWPHSVQNITETVSITENFVFQEQASGLDACLSRVAPALPLHSNFAVQVQRALLRALRLMVA